MTAQHADEQGNNALGDDGIAVGSENNLTVNRFASASLTLAPVDEVLRGFLFWIEGLQVIANVDKLLVAIHPVVEHAELVNYLILCLIYSHIGTNIYPAANIM